MCDAVDCRLCCNESCMRPHAHSLLITFQHFRLQLSTYHRENKRLTVELHRNLLLRSSFSKNINPLSAIKSDMPSVDDVRKGFKLTKKNEKIIKATGDPF